MYFLGVYYVSGSFLGTGDTAVTKTDMVLSCMQLIIFFLGVQRINGN